MTFENILFYFFGAMTIISSLMVISSKNPIHSVLFLILVFCNSSALFILLGVEFIAIIFVIVYVGAIAILFLFVVMMLNIKLVEINENMLRYLPIGGLIGAIFLFEIFLILDKNFGYIPFTAPMIQQGWDSNFLAYSNIELIGLVLYDNYKLIFIASALILLLAMVGSIILTLYQQANVKRQDVFKQTSRHFTRSIILKS